MFPFIYVEKEVEEHPTAASLLKRFSKSQKVSIERYGEVFNRVNQNFRLQKQNPSLILAKKRQNFILEVPEGYGIGTSKNYYFSHLLNCPYDCRYCFLQGMYASAHFVFFLNFEDFQTEIEKMDDSDTTFFTGYDCDSLGLESITGFAKAFVPFIQNSKALFEFRTKSALIAPFLNHQPLSNCVLSWTLSLENIQKKWEDKTASLEKRLIAMEELQKRGWLLGLRFDPLIECPEWEKSYQTFFADIFQRISLKAIHSITLGSFRTPKPLFKKMVSLYPKEPLFAGVIQEKNNLITIQNQSLLSFCKKEVLKYAPSEKIFTYHD